MDARAAIIFEISYQNQTTWLLLAHMMINIAALALGTLCRIHGTVLWSQPPLARKHVSMQARWARKFAASITTHRNVWQHTAPPELCI